MTAGAVPDDVAVVEARSRPSAGRMAAAAILHSAYVSGGLSSCLHAIVARGAAAAHDTVIEPSDLPLLGRVAAVATGLRGNVVGRASFGPDRVVTIGAAPRCAGEVTVDMASCAFGTGVFAGKREAGTEMVEFGARGLFLRVGQGRQECQSHKHGTDCREPF